MRMALQLTGASSLSGFSQIAIPVQTKTHWRIGVSSMGPGNSDEMLLAFAEALHSFDFL